MNKTGGQRPNDVSRRSFLINGAKAGSMAALAFCSAPSSFALHNSPTPLIHTPSGNLRGESVDSIRIFRGIPFAEPPVGELRFRPTVRAKPWTGERDATRFGHPPMQFGGSAASQSEDCLQLNIWAPEDSGPFPVFVWIHGGSFTGGYAFDPVFDGSAFARDRIVCVTIAYRLGVFGFLDLEPLLGSEYAGAANNALHDLITALQWIQENIAAFGGDPSRVTLGGESAGAKLTDTLMGVPAARPLFQQMISESGGAERIWQRSQAASVATGFAETWSKQSGKDVHALLTEPAASLIQVQHQFIADWPQHFPLRVEIDGALLPQLPVETIAAGSTRGKRLLIGTNRDESALFIGPHPATDVAAKDLGNISVERFLPVYQRYKGLYPELTAEQLRIRALSAEEYWVPSVRVADAHLQGGGAAWMYRLDFSESSGWLKGYAYHSLDIELVWNRPHVSVENAGAEIALARQVHQAWVAFIHGEVPGAPGLPDWHPYLTVSRPTMILGTQSRMEEKPQEAELRLWDGIL